MRAWWAERRRRRRKQLRADIDAYLKKTPRHLTDDEIVKMRGER